MNDTWKTYYQNTSKRQVRELFKLVLMKYPSNAVGLRATDIGCGDGTETKHLLSQGWHVHAIDAEPTAMTLLRSKLSENEAGQLETQVANFWEAHYPPADLIYAGFSLPFCPPEHFQNVWQQILANLKANGHLTVHFFGEDDEWHDQPGMSFHSKADITALTNTLTLKHLEEIRETRATASGRVKRWHVFEVICKNM